MSRNQIGRFGQAAVIGAAALAACTTPAGVDDAASEYLAARLDLLADEVADGDACDAVAEAEQIVSRAWAAVGTGELPTATAAHIEEVLGEVVDHLPCDQGGAPDSRLAVDDVPSDPDGDDADGADDTTEDEDGDARRADDERGSTEPRGSGATDDDARGRDQGGEGGGQGRGSGRDHAPGQGGGDPPGRSGDPPGRGGGRP